MAGPLNDPESLFLCNWVELRSEVSKWDDADDGMVGYDGFSRFWCKHAVFDVYWVAEGEVPGQLVVYLTKDLLITGFRQALPFECNEALLVRLAKRVGWAGTVERVLQKLLETQLELFEGK